MSMRIIKEMILVLLSGLVAVGIALYVIDQVPVNPGIYHKNFFERLRSVLALLREQIEDSRTWNSMFAGRKKKKGYWSSYKKHGTQFGLSNERTVATQAG